jgi:hypothetical protein
MPSLNAPNTTAVGQAIVGFAAALTYSGGAAVYKTTQLGEIKDIIDQTANGAACFEVYANHDDSQHKAFGGKIFDEQTWFLLSLVSLDNAQSAETLIYQVRDALVVPFQTHATLNNAGSVYHSQILPHSSHFLKVLRNGQWFRGHVLELMTRQEWFVPTPPGVIA